ncbi:MAG: MFS transporter [Desulfomonilaceae bacterium]
MQPTLNPQKLITKDFLALNAIVFLTYCNVAVFFEFHHYLGTLPINDEWFGLLIALFSVAVLVIRPIISPLLHPDNAKRWIGISCVWVIVSLLLYNVAHDFWTMTIVRLLHGAAYVVMATAVVSRLVGGIPRDKSAQAFGLISVITLLPYAVVPPILEPLTRWAGGFENMLNLSCVLMALSFPLLAMIGTGPSEVEGQPQNAICWQDVLENLKDARILSLMVISLVVWTSYTPVFYFLKGQGEKIGVTNPGWFFTLSTFAEISVRLLAGPLFDKLDKSKVLLGSLLWLGFSNLVMAHVSGPIMFYTMGVVLGLGWGIAMPVLSGLTFDVSEPRFRALNTNLAMEMFQCGFFVGPLAGGTILIHSGYATLYYACAGLLFAGLATAPVLYGIRATAWQPANEERIWKRKSVRNR